MTKTIKKTYIKPEINIENFELTDIIMTSDPQPPGPGPFLSGDAYESENQTLY